MPVFQRRYLLIAALLLSQGLISIFGGLVSVAAPRGETIFPGVFISGTEVSNLTKEQAIKLLEQKITGHLNARDIALRYGEREWLLSSNQLGVRFDVPATVEKALAVGRQHNLLRNSLEIFQVRYQKPDLPLEYTVDESQLNRIVAKIAGEINTPPRNASVGMDSGNLKILPEVVGKSCDLAANTARIKPALGKIRIAPITLEVSETPPQVTAADLKEIRESIGLGVTAFTRADPERVKNILLAVKTLDGIITRPGEVFSFNHIVGPRVKEKGYHEAPLIIEGRLSRGSGGGVCQVATTLYQAVLYSGLRVKERYAHTAPLEYVALGQDAAVAYGKLDLKFENNTRYPLYISASVKDNHIIIDLLGVKKSGRTIQVVTKETVLRQKTGAAGRHADVYRIYFNHGVADKKELVSEDDYLETPVRK